MSQSCSFRLDYNLPATEWSRYSPNAADNQAKIMANTFLMNLNEQKTVSCTTILHVFT